MSVPLQLAYEADAPSDLPPLLLVHGLLVSRKTWLPNIERLSKHFRLIRVDLPAHGASPAPATPEAARPETIVAALEALREKLGIVRWHLCGQSFGAAITLRYALDHQESCLGHVFTNANGAFRETWSDAYRQSHEELVAQVRMTGHAAIETMPYHPKYARRFAPEIRAILTAEADVTDAQGIALLLQEATPRMSVRVRIEQLQVPTLLVNGLYERRFQSTRDWLEMVVPAMAIVDLEGGHSINVECPEVFDAAVIAFLTAIGEGEG